VGVIKVLFETKLLPKILSGSSGGSIVAAVVGTRTDEELPAMMNPENLSLDVFERPEEQGNIFIRLTRLFRHG
jgi:TAG lipase/steryl ester hydrolase/phospholipase A2/LPA acyltransferase